MAAWRATRFILEALESIDRQEPRPGWSYSLRVGVDGCEATSRLLFRAGRPHWYSPKNVGAYVMRNSLIQLEPAAAYAIFDADDLMKRDYLRTLLGGIGSDGIAGGGRTHVDENRKLMRRRVGYRHGVAVISHAAWEKVGGYRPWPIAADHDLIMRAKNLGVPVRPTNKALYLRRVHPSSLTQNEKTGWGTELRRQFANRSKYLVKVMRDLYVHPVTTELELREP